MISLVWICATLLLARTAHAFVPSSTTLHTVALAAAPTNDGGADFMRWARASRSAQAGDNLVELNRPLGVVLNEDEYGNVYVEAVAPRGNAARTGKVGNVAVKCDE
jgi:hypothetical protein